MGSIESYSTSGFPGLVIRAWPLFDLKFLLVDLLTLVTELQGDEVHPGTEGDVIRRQLSMFEIHKDSGISQVSPIFNFDLPLFGSAYVLYWQVLAAQGA